MKAINRGNEFSQNIIGRLTRALVVAGIVACVSSGFTQTLSIQSDVAQPAQPDSIVQLTADAQGLPLVPPDALPRSGTFWLVMSGIDGGVTAPMPCPPKDTSLPIYQIANGQFLVDATGGQVAVSPGFAGRRIAATTVTAALEQEASSVVNLITRIQTSEADQQTQTTMQAMGMDVPSPGDGGSDTNGIMANGLSSSLIPDYGTNLWIAQVTVLSGNLNGLGTNTQADIQYDIMSRTNLLQTDWQYEGTILGSKTTNWTPLTVSQNGRPILFLRLRSDADDGSGLPIWWQLQYFGTTGVNPNAPDPAGDGWSNWQKFQMGLNPNVFYTPPAPQGLRVSYNAGTSTATINWQPSSGAVTGYSLTMPSGTVTLSSNALSYADTDPNLATALISDNYNYGSTSFQLEALYSAGNSDPATADLRFGVPNIWLVEGTRGSNFLAVSALPPGTTAIRLIREDTVAESYGNYSFNASNDIPLISFTNGLFYLPPGLTTAPIDGYVNPVTGYLNNNYFWFAQALNASGVPISPSVAFGQNSNTNVNYGIDGINPLYLDGRVQLKQNLIFLLRAATVSNSFGYYLGPAYSDWAFPRTYSINCAVADFYQDFEYYDEYNVAGFLPLYEIPPFIPVQLNVFQPFQDNCLYENCAFNASLLNYGKLTTGVFPAGGLPNDDYMVCSNVQTYTFNQPTTNGTPITALGPDGARWLMTGQHSFNPNYLDEIGVDRVHYWPTNVMLNSVSNLFGLPFLSTKVALSDGSGQILTLSPGGGTTKNSWFYSETAQPNLAAVEYDFWNAGYWDVYGQWQNPDPLPEEGDFSPTNQSDHALVVPVGASIQVAGYKKLAVLNGYSGVYGYLGQYFDQAYQIDANGNITANTTGVLSPYGQFFATQPGPVALVTMPDIDSPYQRGTCTVYCVSLQLDRNHDGTMDLSFNGPDATSVNSPYIFWCDSNFDRWATTSNPLFTETEQDDQQIAFSPATPITPTPDCNYSNVLANGYAYRAIPCTRDLEDFARLWVCGITTNLLAALPAGSTITLNWGDVGYPDWNGNNPTIDLFQAADADGGIGYQTNETIAAAQTNVFQNRYIGRLGPGQSIQLNPSSGWAGNHFIWCGVSNGVGGLNLTITDGSGNVLAQTTAYIQIMDIKQMYERWTVGDKPSVAPTTSAVLVKEGLQPGASAFEYTPPTDPNTPYILLVHGYNMKPWEKDRFAEAAYKRLYWQGYQGRFGAFNWPTAQNAIQFGSSELQAWQSAQGLLNKLNDLNAEYPGQVYLAAHSLGNVVAGEALRLAGSTQVVNTYVAMQGAVSAHAYDPNTTPYILTEDWGAPDCYAHYWTSNAPCYFNASAGAGTYVNFYNTNDWALGGVWLLFQNSKPVLDLNYSFSPPNFYFKNSGSTELFFPANTYELFDEIIQSRSYALGMQPNVGGDFLTGTNYNQVELDIAPYNFSTEHIYHSGEFRSDNPQRWQFWNEVLVKMKLKSP